MLLPLLDISSEMCGINSGSGTPGLTGDTGAAKVELIGLTILSLGLIFSGGRNPDIVSAIVQSLMSLDEKELDHPYLQLALLGLSFLFLGSNSSLNGEDEDDENLITVVLESLRVIPHSGIVKQAEILLSMMANAGSGNVLLIQECIAMLCGGQQPVAIGDLLPPPPPESDSSDPTTSQQHDAPGRAYAVLALAAISMGEELGTEMSFRLLGHLVIIVYYRLIF